MLGLVTFSLVTLNPVTSIPFHHLRPPPLLASQGQRPPANSIHLALSRRRRGAIASRPGTGGVVLRTLRGLGPRALPGCLLGEDVVERDVEMGMGDGHFGEVFYEA